MSKQVSTITMYKNASVNIGDVSEHILMRGFDKVQFYGGSVTGSGSFTVQNSADMVSWYNTGQQVIISANDGFFGWFDNTGIYVRVKFDCALTGLNMKANIELH